MAKTRPEEAEPQAAALHTELRAAFHASGPYPFNPLECQNTLSSKQLHSSLLERYDYMH